jgi:hypothetical protein
VRDSHHGDRTLHENASIYMLELIALQSGPLLPDAEKSSRDLSADLLVQLGTVTEHINRHWYEKNTGPWSLKCSARSFTPFTAGINIISKQ